MKLFGVWIDCKAMAPSDSDSDDLIAPLGRELSISCLMRCPRGDYGKVAVLNRSFASLVRSGELYKCRREAGIVEPWVYLSINPMEWEAFDPAKPRWIKVPSMPVEPGFMCSDKESLAVGHELLVFGREMVDMAIYKYRVHTKKWETENPRMNTPRCLFASASAGSIAYVAGGVSIRGEILSSAEVYDSEEGTWTEIPGMKSPRRMCAGVMMDGKFYVIGGAIGPRTNRVVVTSAEVYDPKTKTWEEIADMCPPSTVAKWGCPPLCAVVKNELYAAEVNKMELWRYVKEQNVWVTIGSLPARVSCTTGYGMAFRACGDRLLVIGRADDGIGVVEIHSWVPPEPAVGNGGGGNAPPPPPQWEVIGRRNTSSYVYNCAIMSC